MRGIGPNNWASKEEVSPLMGGHSDPSEEYGSQSVNTDVGTQPASPCKLNHNHNYCSKNYYNGNARADLGAKKCSIGRLGKLRITTVEHQNSECVSSGDSVQVSHAKHKSKAGRIFPRMLKSLSFLVALSSVNSFALALNDDGMESALTGSRPLPVSLVETGSSLIELESRVGMGRLNRLASFFQSTLTSSKNEKKKRSGGNRRSSKGKKGKGDEEDDKRNKWSEYMAKFDIAKVHGSGVYVDLGGFANVGGYDYRMPTGKCPVVGKAIVLENGADFLKSIAHHDPKERGLAFPATKVSSNSSEVDMESQQLSPISAQVLRSWSYKHESDLSNCAEYARNIVPGSNRDSKYRYPFVYDQDDKLCYILYSPMQYNQGVKYCDTDSPDEGSSSLACMYPDKDKEDSHLFYGTSSLHMDWMTVCPVYPVKDAIFGAYNQETDECVPLDPIYIEEADEYSECARILFEYSPSDVDVTTNNQDLTDVDRYKEAIRTGKISSALSIMFSPRYSEDRPIYTKGVGINWATYSVAEKKCRILDEIPSCLIISNGHYALTSLSSPNEDDAVPYPCDIKQGKGFLKNPGMKKKPKAEGAESPEEGDQAEGAQAKGKEKKEKAKAEAEAGEFVPYTSTQKEGFVCDKFVHVRSNGSCGSYVECSASPLPIVSSKVAYIVVIILSILALGVIAFVVYKFYTHRRYKRYGSEVADYNFENMYDSDLEDNRMDEYGGSHVEGQVWDRHEPRESEFTPVRISRVERHN